MHCLSFVSLACLAASLTTAAPSPSSLPQVDLGYEIHQAIALNESAQTYNFTNIRYAQAPVGKLRFAAPQPPTGRNPVVQNGSVGPICPQASPAWSNIATLFSAAYIEGTYTSFNYSAAVAELVAASAHAPPATPDPRTTEDCLFLDVIVPKAVFNKAKSNGKPAAVLVWIYGGGYTEGFKGGYSNPAELIKDSQAGGGEGIIFVEMNYRLGALGWLSGPTLEASGGVSNAGLWDQRLAIEWVAKYIHLFGGDPKRITLLGESAGGGSIMHQITAFGGNRGVSFQQAIPQSPAWLPIVSKYSQENTTQTFLKLLNVSTIAEAQEVSSNAVIAASAGQIGTSDFGQFVYGPAVDGVFVPALPGELLSYGAFAQDVKVMAGHNTHEGVSFTDPRVQTDAELETYLKNSFPGIQPSIVQYIVKDLYPAKYDGSQPYTNSIDRTIFLITESIFTCNVNYLGRALGNKTYNYQFEVPPALHGFDVSYTFWNGAPTNVTTIPPLIAPIAETLQNYIVNFVLNGNPNGKGLPNFPIYGSDAMQLGLNETVSSQVDPNANPRCYFWQKGLLS